MRRVLVLLAAALLAVPAGHAKTVAVRTGWDEARAMLDGGEYRPKIRVELQSSERAKGKFIEATGAGLRIAGKGYETRFAREDIRTIRLVPRKTGRFAFRLLGLLAGIPAGVIAGRFLALACCVGEKAPVEGDGAGYITLIGTSIAIPYGLYQLGARADRGTVLIVLDENAEKKLPVPPQSEQPSSSEEEQP